jgi:DNA (cytosine-5)-methyltransferase 1
VRQSPTDGGSADQRCVLRCLPLRRVGTTLLGRTVMPTQMARPARRVGARYSPTDAQRRVSQTMARVSPMSFAEAEPSSNPEVDQAGVERYRRRGPRLQRLVERRNGPPSSSFIRDGLNRSDDPFSDFWRAWLRGEQVISVPTGQEVTSADLFTGCGGLSLGVDAACQALGASHRTLLAVDTNRDALSVFQSNFDPVRTHDGPIEEIVDGHLGADLTRAEAALAEELDGLTLAVGGPPCQGHSDLNNHTRRSDTRNGLYLRMARFIEVVRPTHAIIENVPGVVHDVGGVVARTRQHLIGLGYRVTDGVVACDTLGWPQRRKRHLMLASLTADNLDAGSIATRFARPALPVLWAVGDEREGTGVFRTAATHNRVNQARIEYLFDNDLYDLPDEMRPDCHRLKPHSYKSVYGRMRPDQPAPTVTSGFGSTGQGRFVHPLQPRTLTPQEAAALQGFPRSFSFDGVEKRGALQEMIGNAVPSRLAYAAALEVLR